MPEIILSFQRKEHFIEYAKLDMKDIADKKPGALVHQDFAQVLRDHHEAFEEVYGQMEINASRTNEPLGVYQVRKWLDDVNGILEDRQKTAENDKRQAARSHARFLNRLSAYPLRGIFDGAIRLDDPEFFQDLTNECTKRYPDPKGAAKEILQRFRWCNPRGKELGPDVDFSIPLLMVEHKRKDINIDSRPKERDGKNQRLMYCTGAARFLHEMGLNDYPVFGFSTAGPRASLCISWYSPVQVGMNRFSTLITNDYNNPSIRGSTCQFHISWKASRTYSAST